MKKILLFLFLSGFCFNFSSAQNLVPNWSFEDYNQCPNYLNQFNKVNNWLRFDNHSPDYYNACDVTNQAGVPINIAGFQFAYAGQAYAGVHPFSLNGNQTTSYREYFGCQFAEALVINTKY